MNNDEDQNSWMNAQQPTNGMMIETPAFNNKAHSLGDTSGLDNDQIAADFECNDPYAAAAAHNQTQSFLLDDHQMSLSQHAIVSFNDGEEQKQVEIREVSYQRSNQQYQSTPIHNFRTLRSREISVNHSQNTLEEVGRPRSDSIETDKGNPNQDKILSNLESHLMNEGNEGLDLTGSENIIILANNSSFESPRRNTSVPHEESKGELRDLITPQVDTTFMPVAFDFQEEVKPFNEQPTSKKRIAREATGQRSASASRQRDTFDNPRRSKRLENRHNALLQSGTMQRQESYLDPEDELNGAQSQ